MDTIHCLPSVCRGRTISKQAPPNQFQSGPPPSRLKAPPPLPPSIAVSISSKFAVKIPRGGRKKVVVVVAKLRFLQQFGPKNRRFEPQSTCASNKLPTLKIDDSWVGGITASAERNTCVAGTLGLLERTVLNRIVFFKHRDLLQSCRLGCAEQKSCMRNNAGQTPFSGLGLMLYT